MKNTRLVIVWFVVFCWGCDGDPGEKTSSDSTVVSDTNDADDTAETVVGPPPDFTEERDACANSDPLKRVFFGDLHVHTSYSFDAYIFDTRIDPFEAYRFAQGEAVKLPPIDPSTDAGTETLQLERPLDFAAVTDHSEYLGEVQGCSTPSSPVYDTVVCQQYREGSDAAVFSWGFPLTSTSPGRLPICGINGFNCKEEGLGPWENIQQAAEEAYDRTSACNFTSFVAYEWSGAPNISNMHRNIIFRNHIVPDAPISYYDESSPLKMWRLLDEQCQGSGKACDVMSQPHNSNWSNGNLFYVDYPGTTSLEEEREQAEFRARMEPTIEIYQHKGDSECINGLSSVLGEPDEFCNFEKLPKNEFEDCGDGRGRGAMAGTGCTSRLDFVRGIFKAGLQEQERLGINPYKLGIIASTDTHNGIPGATEEDAFKGHWGNNEQSAERRLERGNLTPAGVYFSAGGLSAIWAEENTRESLFSAMRNKETYGTSGTRIAVRFFGGWDYPADLCGAPDLVQTGYDKGVPMGGTLAAAPDGSTVAPAFIVSALRDPGTASRPGTPLQRIQVIKGWLDANGEVHETVYDVAGDPNNGASVDVNTCETSGTGFDSLCEVWTDPDFDAEQHAFYYARVIENPTCRWSNWQCIRFDLADMPETCNDPAIPKTIYERAWTSPIWYTPPT